MDSPNAAAELTDAELEEELARRRAATRHNAERSGGELAAAVERFLAHPVNASALDADEAWASEWIGPSGGLRVGDIQALNRELQRYRAAQDDPSESDAQQ